MGLFLTWAIRSVENTTEKKGQKKNKDGFAFSFLILNDYTILI